MLAKPVSCLVHGEFNLLSARMSSFVELLPSVIWALACGRS